MKNICCFKKIFFSFLFVFLCQTNLFCSKRWSLRIQTSMPTCVTWLNNMLCVGSMDGSVDLFKIKLSRKSSVAGWEKVDSIKSEGNIVVGLASKGHALVVCEKDIFTNQTEIKRFIFCSPVNRFIRKRRKGFPIYGRGDVVSTAFSNDGKYFVCAFSGGDIVYIDAQTLKPNRNIDVQGKQKKLLHNGWGLTSFALDPNNNKSKIFRSPAFPSEIVINSYDRGLVNFIRCNFKKCEKSISGYEPLFTSNFSDFSGCVTALEWKNGFIAAGSDTGEIKVFSVSKTSGKDRELKKNVSLWMTLKKEGAFFHDLSLNNNILASVAFDGSIDLWDISKK